MSENKLTSHLTIVAKMLNLDKILTDVVYAATHDNDFCDYFNVSGKTVVIRNYKQVDLYSDTSERVLNSTTEKLNDFVVCVYDSNADDVEAMFSLSKILGSHPTAIKTPEDLVVMSCKLAGVVSQYLGFEGEDISHLTQYLSDETAGRGKKVINTIGINYKTLLEEVEDTINLYLIVKDIFNKAAPLKPTHLSIVDYFNVHSNYTKQNFDVSTRIERMSGKLVLVLKVFDFNGRVVLSLELGAIETLADPSLNIKDFVTEILTKSFSVLTNMTELLNIAGSSNRYKAAPNEDELYKGYPVPPTHPAHPSNYPFHPFPQQPIWMPDRTGTPINPMYPYSSSSMSNEDVDKNDR
ncbi:MAG: hypothetical protein M0R77_00495 [Gammaproteobacteria bacterium]|nr:hypothetical protein [Acholeplasmataceae bacterium]MCK9529033.1 hypothetical protein [Gammaproteobacteria bacterium]